MTKNAKLNKLSKQTDRYIALYRIAIDAYNQSGIEACKAEADYYWQRATEAADECNKIRNKMLTEQMVVEAKAEVERAKRLARR